jgi:predicted anti-sigma-YlaC factor YlaD
MECDRAREVISARIDGEDGGLPDGVLDAHLAGCGACRDWQHRAHEVTRRARLGGVFLERDLTAGVLAAVPPAGPGRWRRRLQRAGLAAVALAQAAITVPLLILGHDHGAGVHAAHELGSFDLALAVAFAVGAIRPSLSAGLAWPCGIAAVGLVITAVIDMIGGQTAGPDEAQHLIAVAGALLLLRQARAAGRAAAGPAAAAMPPAVPDREPAREAGPDHGPWRQDAPGPHGGGDAARAAGPAQASGGDAARGDGKVA